MTDLNLFELLARYSNPTGYENFLSIGLAWCLENDQEFKKCFFKKVLDVEDFEGWVIEVQKAIKVGARTKYPDLLLSNNGRWLIIEVKADAGISYSAEEGAENQNIDEEHKWRDRLSFYREWLDGQGTKSKDALLFLLTRDYIDEHDLLIKKSETRIIYWNALGEIEIADLSEIAKQFIVYLREEIIMESMPLDICEKLDDYRRLTDTMGNYMQYSYSKLKAEYHFKENTGINRGSIHSGYFFTTIPLRLTVMVSNYQSCILDFIFPKNGESYQRFA